MRIAAVQAAPVFLDRESTVQKACSLVREAAAGGAFGEGFLPGHPIWYHLLPATDPQAMRLAAELVENAITVPGPEVAALTAVARETGAMVVMGVVERERPGRSVIFSSALAIGVDGVTAATRRKLVPAVGERIVFTPGAGDGIRTFEATWGEPVSVLLGGENSNPLLTYAMRSLGARVHVAGWPPHFNQPGIMRDIMTITGQAIAYQNTAYVIAVAGASTPDATDRIARTDEQRALFEAMAADGGSMVFAPRGKLLAGPAPGGDHILYADADPSAGTWAQLVNRQYDRPDLLHLRVDRRPAAAEIELTTGSADVDLTAGEPGASGDGAVRAMIQERFGSRLSPADAEELVPYVRAVLRRSEELEAFDLTQVDPRDTTFADDPRRLGGPRQPGNPGG